MNFVDIRNVCRCVGGCWFVMSGSVLHVLFSTGLSELYYNFVAYMKLTVVEKEADNTLSTKVLLFLMQFFITLLF